MYQIIQQFLLIFGPAFVLGILHTAIPCEDKAIFFFWSFGIAKNARRSLFILILYGLGLISANMLIAVISILISLVPVMLGFTPDPFTINFFGAFSSTFAAIILLFLITQKDYSPHSRFGKDIVHLNWEKSNTSFFFGILTGFTPCIFELIIYSQSLTLSIAVSYVQGLLIVFYFSLGTFVGLFPLALAKQGTSHLIKSRKKRSNKVFFAMIAIIIVFNVIVMILSFFRIPVFELPTSGYTP